jgi:hypothetical protein
VRQEAPGGGVPLRGKQVAPVLPDEPCAEKGHDFRAVCYSPDLGDPSHEEDGEEAESKRELMYAKATEVDARTKTMPFEAQHARRVDIDR